MTRSGRLGSRRWALRWCGCGITSSLRIRMRRGSTFWRGLRGGGGGGRWWAACAAGALPPSPRRGGGCAAGCSSALTPALSLTGEGAGLPPSPQPSPSRARGPDFRPHASAVPRGRGGRTSALTPALSLAGEGGRGRPPGGKRRSREAVGRRGFVGEGWMVGGCAAGALPPSPQPSPSRARGWEVVGGLCRRLLFRPHPSPLPHGCIDRGHH